MTAGLNNLFLPIMLVSPRPAIAARGQCCRPIHGHPELAAAGLWTTPSDLARVVITLQDALAGRATQLLKPEMAREMLTASISNAGLGVFLTGPNGPSRRFTHSGRNAGFDGMLVGYKNGRQGAVVMINRNNNEGFVTEVLESIAREYQWPDFLDDRPQREYGAVPAAVQAMYAGSYEAAGQPPLLVVYEDDKLFARSGEDVWFRLYPRSPTEFFVAESSTRWTFVRAADGTVAEVVSSSDTGDVRRRRLSAQARQSSTTSETYQSAAIDANGNLTIVTTSGERVIVRKEAEQTAFSRPVISADRTAVAAQALISNCCTSYDIPVQVVVYARGKVHRFTGGGMAIFKWGFADGGSRIAYGQEPVHFGCGIHYELRDIESESLIESTDVPEPCGQIPNPKPVKIPDWVAKLKGAIAPGEIQDKPDFSGRWKLSGPTVPGAEFPPSFVVRQSIARTNVRGEPMEPSFKDISVEWEFTSGTRVETYGIGGVGGRVSGIDTRPGAPPQTSFSTTHSVRWDGKRLVFETARYERPPSEPRASLYSERVEVWELSADGLCHDLDHNARVEHRDDDAVGDLCQELATPSECLWRPPRCWAQPPSSPECAAGAGSARECRSRHDRCAGHAREGLAASSTRSGRFDITISGQKRPAASATHSERCGVSFEHQDETRLISE
jgi:hypothetical protein